jgi:hypothetical protein
MLLKMGFESKNSLIIVALVDEIKSDLFGELSIKIRVLRIEDVLCLDITMD